MLCEIIEIITIIFAFSMNFHPIFFEIFSIVEFRFWVSILNLAYITLEIYKEKDSTKLGI